MEPAQGPLDPNTVALISIIAIFVSGTLATVLSRVGTKKSEAAKRLDQIIEGLEGDVDRKREDIRELKAELKEAKAYTRELENLRRREFERSIRQLFPELRNEDVDAAPPDPPELSE